MEVIEIPGYTDGDKPTIVKRYLVRRQLEPMALIPSRSSLTMLPSSTSSRATHARPACATSRHNIGSVARAIAAEVVGGKTDKFVVGREQMKKYLGPRKFEPELPPVQASPGVATGMAYTPRWAAKSCSSRCVHAGRRTAAADRPARQGDARERAGGAQPGQEHGGDVEQRSGAVRKERHPCPRTGRRHAQGRAERGASPCSWRSPRACSPAASSAATRR